MCECWMGGGTQSSADALESEGGRSPEGCRSPQYMWPLFPKLSCGIPGGRSPGCREVPSAALPPRSVSVLRLQLQRGQELAAQLRGQRAASVLGRLSGTVPGGVSGICSRAWTWRCSGCSGHLHSWPESLA